MRCPSALGTFELPCIPGELIINPDPDDTLVECVIVRDGRLGIRRCAGRGRRDAVRRDVTKIGEQILNLGTEGWRNLPLDARTGNPAFTRSAP